MPKAWADAGPPDGSRERLISRAAMNMHAIIFALPRLELRDMGLLPEDGVLGKTLG